MRIATLFLLFSLTGCSSILHELKSPPFPYVVIHHTRAVGIEAQIPNQAGDSVVKFRLGFFSDSWELIPCATNSLSIPAISDTFKLGSSVSLSPSTTIVEDVVTGWNGQPPMSRHPMLFSAPIKLRPAVTNAP